MERFSTGYSQLCLPVFENDQLAKLTEKSCSAFFLPCASQVSQCHKGWLPLESCHSLADPVTSGTLKSTWSKWHWSILILLLLETGNCKGSLPADRWLHKVVHLLLIMAERKFTRWVFSWFAKDLQRFSVSPDHKAIRSIASMESANYLNNVKPSAGSTFIRTLGGRGPMWWFIRTEECGLISRCTGPHSQGFVCPIAIQETQKGGRIHCIVNLAALIPKFLAISHSSSWFHL